MAEKRTRRRFLAVSAAVGTTVLAGCSGGGDEDTEDDEPTETTMAPTPTPDEETPTPDDEETPTPDEEETPDDTQPSASVDPWPMARYDLHNTGRNATTSGPVQKPSEDWAVSLDGTPITTPVLGESAVYVGTTNQTLYALSPVDGTELWTVDLRGRPATPAVGSGKVYVPNAGITAYDEESGEEAWHYEGNGARGTAPAAYAGGMVYGAIETANGAYEMYGLQTTGRRQWTQTDLSVGSGSAGPTAIAADGGQLYVATDAPGVLLLDMDTGERGGTLDIGPSPGIALNDEIIAYGGREVGIWDRAEGEVRGTLSQRVDGVDSGTTPMLTEETSVFGTQTGVNAPESGAMALGFENVFKEWDYGSARTMRLPPAGASEMLYAPAMSQLYGIRTFGAGEWTYDLGSEARTAPAVSSGRVFIGVAGPELVALTE